MDWKKFKLQTEKNLKTAIEKGAVDEKIISLLNKINEKENLVTSSSCSGRIALLSIKNGKKDAAFYQKWHREIVENELNEKLEKYDFEKPLWYRCEPFILHVFAIDIKNAEKFLKTVRTIGIKRGGIQTINKKGVLIEIQGSGSIIFPIDKCDIDWKLIIRHSNEILENNFKKIEQIEKALK